MMKEEPPSETAIVLSRRTWPGRNGGQEQTTIWGRIRANGALEISGQDFGPSVESAWGSDDYEYILTVAATDVNRLALALLARGFAGGPSMQFNDLVKLCRDAGISADFSTWP
jgi:hypothetical protein